MMESQRILSTAQAQRKYGLPAKVFAQWCREGKFPNAKKEGGEWRIPVEDIEVFFDANPKLRPRKSLLDLLEHYPLGSYLAAMLALLGFIVDSFAIHDIIKGGNWWLLWALAGTASLGLWGFAWVIRRAKVRTGILGYRGSEPQYKERERYTNPILRSAALLVLWGMPLAVALGLTGYFVWRAVPPQKTVVLVADFVDPTGVDSARVTKSLVEGMEDTLKDHPEIEIKRLRKPVESSEEARKYGNDPRNKAAFVIWGDYTLQPEPEVHVRFDILKQPTTILGTSLKHDYGPAQTLQPRFFDFKTDLSQYLSELVSFATGLALFDNFQYKEAVSFFELASNASREPLTDTDIQRLIRFYLGVTYFHVGKPREAQSNLKLLLPSVTNQIQNNDPIIVATLSALGAISLYQGEYQAASEYMLKALEIYKKIDERAAEASQLNNLGALAIELGKFDKAKDFLNQSLSISLELNDTQGEAYSRVNLGLLASKSGNYQIAEKELKYALKLFRKIRDRQSEAIALANLGTFAKEQRNFLTAQRLFEKALAIDKEIGFKLGERDDLVLLGSLALEIGNYTKSKFYVEQALAIDKEMGSRSRIAQDLFSLGLISQKQNDFKSAYDYYQQSLSISQEEGYLACIAANLSNLVFIEAEQNNYIVARNLLNKVLEIDRKIGDRQQEALDLTMLGLLFLDSGEYEEAHKYLHEALAMERELGNLQEKAYILTNLGFTTILYNGDIETAKNYYEKAKAIYERISDKEGEAEVLMDMGLLAMDLKNYEEAQNLLNQSREIYEELNIPVPEIIDSTLHELSKFDSIHSPDQP